MRAGATYQLGLARSAATLRRAESCDTAWTAVSRAAAAGSVRRAGFHGLQRLAAAPEALVGASAAQRMLAELNQLVYALTPALHRRGAAQRAVLLPAEPVTPSLEPRGESSP